MKKDWRREAKARIGADFEIAGTCLMTAQALVSGRVRKGFQLSKTQVKKGQVMQDEWLRGKLSRLAVLEILLEHRRLLGKIVWRIYRRMVADMGRPASGAVSPEKRDPSKGALDEVACEAVAKAIS